MKPRIPLIIFLLLSCHAQAQKLFTTVYAGISGYQGELSTRPIDPIQSHPSFGLGLQYELNDHWLIRGDFTYGKISGHDKYSLANRNRNLSFASNLSEFSLGIEYIPINLYYYKVSPYAFAGIANYKFSPYTTARNGSRVILSEFSTEGQGFYLDRQPYKLRQFSIPFGGGLLWAVSDNFRVGFVVGFRKTFTDYLDDVSTTYVDKDILAQNRGTNALNYAFRGNELDPSLEYPADGTVRGNPKTKDWYHFSGITVRFRITNFRDRQEQKRERDRGRTDCPVNRW